MDWRWKYQNGDPPHYESRGNIYLKMRCTTHQTPALHLLGVQACSDRGQNGFEGILVSSDCCHCEQWLPIISLLNKHHVHLLTSSKRKLPKTNNQPPMDFPSWHTHHVILRESSLSFNTLILTIARNWSLQEKGKAPCRLTAYPIKDYNILYQLMFHTSVEPT